MTPSRHFPNLTPGNHTETSPETNRYNCIAWAVEDTTHWWQPGIYWLPVEHPKLDYGLSALETVFRMLNYSDCGMDESCEEGYTKVALYGTTFLYTHAARQLPSGKWTSKMGKGVDIEHDTLDVVAGGLYGLVVQIMKRPISAMPST